MSTRSPADDLEILMLAADLAEGSSEPGNMDGKIAFFDEVAVPDRAQEFVFSDNVAGVFDQVKKDVEGLGG